MPRPKVILLDAVGTVIESFPSVAAAYQSAALSIGLGRDIDQLKTRFREAIRRYSVQAFQASRGQADPLQTDEAAERQRWLAIVSYVVDPPEHLQLDLFEKLWDHFADPQHWRVFPDVSPALSKLAAAGFRLGLASNFDERLRPIVAQHFPAFDLCLFISSEMGWVKPSHHFYESATTQLNVAPDEVLLIGDDWENDVESPKNFGWQTIFLNRTDQALPGDITNHFRNLDETAEAILRD
ncbi:HAD family hydrolase [Bremerella sp. T1]|uniref:HAD family hydrolase n=1 Tax=Bremerella sp. TYQ1 TaxID=3119568 RepID=UPI001CCB1371|nr:HAD-IA family hydrolase [Bremerella volcania]UBM35777.1 HAD-IA family hydrolase [Bremerella volcania]